MASANVKKIERALSELGLIPRGRDLEMQGVEGGWFIEAADPLPPERLCGSYVFMGSSVDEVLEGIYKHTERQEIDVKIFAPKDYLAALERED